MFLLKKVTNIDLINKLYMLINKLFKDSEILEYIGIILFLIIVATYYYYHPDIINASDSIDIAVELSSKPKYEEPNGDNVSDISFYCKGYDKDFSISHCALQLIQKNDILKLNKGDSLILTVERSDLLYKKNKLVHHPITICAVTTIQKGEILNLNAYNRCQRNSWKKLRFIIYIVSFLFLIAVISKIKKLFYHKFK